MARYRCPSCGAPYNGKRCKSCLYENFSEEIAHGMHTHEGEPLVIDEPVRKPIPRQNPFACPPKRPAKTWTPPKQKPRKKKSGLSIALAVLAILWLAEPILGGIGQIVDSFSQFSSVSAPQPEPEPDATLPANGTVLFDDGQVRVVADRQDGQAYLQDFPVAVQNSSGEPLCVSVDDVIVNGYVMPASLYCEVAPGHTGQDDFYLYQEDLDNAGIDSVQQISFRLDIYNTDTYETYHLTEPITLLADDPDYVQPDADQGTELFNQDGLRIVYRGYVPASYDPESLADGDLLFYLENNTGKDLEVYTIDSGVNGESAEITLWSSLPRNTRAVSTVYLYPLEDLGITSLEEITRMEISLEAYAPEEEDYVITTGTLSVPVSEE